MVDLVGRPPGLLPDAHADITCHRCARRHIDLGAVVVKCDETGVYQDIDAARADRGPPLELVDATDGGGIERAVLPEVGLQHSAPAVVEVDRRLEALRVIRETAAGL